MSLLSETLKLCFEERYPKYSIERVGIHVYMQIFHNKTGEHIATIHPISNHINIWLSEYMEREEYTSLQQLLFHIAGIISRYEARIT